MTSIRALSNIRISDFAGSGEIHGPGPCVTLPQGGNVYVQKH